MTDDTTTIDTTTIEASTVETSAASSTAVAAPVGADESTLVHLDPATLTIGTNVRLDARLDAEFVASIKARGVLVPIVAVRHADGAHVVRYGQRRTLGAVQAKRATVPVFVVNDTDEAGRLIDQMAENDHRKGLTAGERLAGFEQLAALGMTAAQIAKQTATDRGEVRAALKVAKNATATAAVTNHAVSFTEAVVLGEFDDDAEATARLMRVLGTGQFDHTAQQLRDARAERQRVEKFAAGLRRDGATVLAERPRWSETPKPFNHLWAKTGERVSEADQLANPDLALLPVKVIGWVNAADGNPIAELNGDDVGSLEEIGWHDADEHWNRIDRTNGPDGSDDGAEQAGEQAAAEDDENVEDDEDQDEDEDEDEDQEEDDEDEAERLVHDDGTRAEWGEYLGTERWCTNPAAHGYTDQNPLYSNGYGSSLRKKAQDMEPAERAAASAERRDVIQSNKAWDSAQTVRRAWLQTFLGRKTPPKGSGHFLAVALLLDLGLLADASKTRHQVTASLSLSKTPAEHGSMTLLRTAAAKTMTDQRGTVIALGVVLSAYEAVTHRGSWRRVDDSTRRYLEFLSANGYELSTVEHRACGHPTATDDEQQDE
ncbi:ParB/RepB/Spo0J family partition protein [Kineococcus sp. R86509]|uniref:ParB/RepB/Spo0J family partition protein n=1 Tax=Kineococcus sp. R86509 TaxID=3093851 RepID=UPI0036D359B9